MNALKIFFLSLALMPAARAASSPGDEKDLGFVSEKAWGSGRWYVMGYSPDGFRVEWLGGKKSKFSFEKAGGGKCSVGGESSLQLRRLKRRLIPQAVKEQEQLEILGAGEWFAIEVSPNLEEESFEAQVTGLPEGCLAHLDLRYGWGSPVGANTTPVLLLSATNNHFYGKQISIDAPPSEDKESDVQLDMLLGFWKGTFPNAADGANRSLSFVPTATARGEWLLPFWKHVGLNVALEQTVVTIGTAADQTARFSDWQAGAYYEFYLPVADTLQLRTTFNYRHHLADDSTKLPTLASANKSAKYLTTGESLSLYFARQWMLGFEGAYGYPNAMSGQGAKQSYWEAKGTLGFRVSRFLLLLSEFGERNYLAVGSQAEKVMYGQMGIRLQL